MDKTTSAATIKFLELVKIDSPSGHEEKMSKFMKTWLQRNKFVFKTDKTGNIYASNGKGGRPLLLCAHMDTVQPGEGIKPRVENGIVKSSGDTILGADNKAAIAAIMAASEKNSNRHLELLFTVKEETGGGVEYFPFDWIKSKTALVFDSANPLGGIVLRSPHICNFRISIKGKAAHASLPGQGINAFLPAFAAMPAIPLGFLDNGESTVNIGKIMGGDGVNTVPGKIEIQGEVRSYNKDFFEVRTGNIKSIFKNASDEAGTTFSFETGGYCEGYNHKQENETVKKISDLYGGLGLMTQYYNYSGVSDANVLNGYGITTFNLTCAANFTHTTAEEIAVKDLDKLADIILACINKL